MITASHNPPHDNGMKFYSADGGQVVEPHASGITRHFKTLSENAAALPALLATIKTPGETITLEPEIDIIYRDAVGTLVLEPEAVLETRNRIKFVYTALHGTGIRQVPALLDQFDFRYSIVEKQVEGDGRFPTVKSPNPENAEALDLAIKQAEAEHADIVMATDPDADRMGVAVRAAAARWCCSPATRSAPSWPTTAWTGSSRRASSTTATARTRSSSRRLSPPTCRSASPRTSASAASRRSPASSTSARRCTTTRRRTTTRRWRRSLPRRGARRRCWPASSSCSRRGELRLHRRRLRARQGRQRGGADVRGGRGLGEVQGPDAGRLPRRDLPAARLLFGEARHADLRGRVRRGADPEAARVLPRGAAEGLPGPGGHQGRRLRPGGLRRRRRQAHPKETMLMFHLADGSRMVVRGSGTEPKIKFYFLARADASGDLALVKQERQEFLDAWWAEVQDDVKKRVA
ncbi:MAG: hypothetical protein WDO13_17750 [Verrucomicrobiota bacterium]